MIRDAGMDARRLRWGFLLVWALWLAFKLLLAANLAPFGDEAFYAWESRHLAWAYSDLPGLSAWMVGVGRSLFGETPLAWRLPFLLMAAGMPWQLRAIARAWFDEASGWRAGLLGLLLPLSAALGVLALPDVPLVCAALLCVQGLARLASRCEPVAAAILALGLVLGALAHYRFAAIILAGALGLLAMPQRRELLRYPGLWLALLIGALAWWPLLAWNFAHGEAGLSFQLVDRHPWAFHADGIDWLQVQAVVQTPGLFALLVWAWWTALRAAWRGESGPWALLAVAGGMASLVFLPLAFYVDRERLSLHWPYAGWLLLCIALAALWRQCPRILRLGAAMLAAVGALTVNAYLALAAMPSWRAEAADSRYYPDNFAGWNEIVAAVGPELRARPQTRLIADNFMLAAQLATRLALDDARLRVLDHPLNRKHGRAIQLQLWGVADAPDAHGVDRESLLVVEDSARPLKDRLQAYHALCARFGGLPPARALNVDHGRKRFLLFRLQPGARHACATPALAYVDAPLAGATVDGDVLSVRGWAFKDGVGLRKVEILIDGQRLSEAEYGSVEPKVAAFWKRSDDPNQPRVGLRAEVDLRGIAPGTHWLGLRLHAADDRSEDWPEQRLETRR